MGEKKKDKQVNRWMGEGWGLVSSSTVDRQTDRGKADPMDGWEGEDGQINA